jgi:hypothetical protein
MNRSIRSAITIVPRDDVDLGHASAGGVSWHGRRGIAGLRIAAVDRDIWTLPLKKGQTTESLMHQRCLLAMGTNGTLSGPVAWSH